MKAVDIVYLTHALHKLRGVPTCSYPGAAAAADALEKFLDPGWCKHERHLSAKPRCWRCHYETLWAQHLLEMPVLNPKTKKLVWQPCHVAHPDWAPDCRGLRSQYRVIKTSTVNSRRR